jgi:hypothetical protein
MNFDLFSVFQRRRTLAIVQPAETSQASFMTACGNQAFPHCTLWLACDGLLKTSFVEEGASHFSHEERFFWKPEHML